MIDRNIFPARRPEPSRPAARRISATLSTLTLAVTLALAAAPPTARAQDAATTIDIARQPLGAALLQLGQQTSLQFIYTSDLVRGLAAPAVTGTMTAEDALRRLISGTGLEYSRSGNTIHLRRAGGTATLAPVEVAGSYSAVSEGTGSYTALGPTRTATGFDLSLRETPQSVTVMTRQRLEDFNLYTLSDVLQQTPGVAVDRQGDAFNFTVRGSAVNMQIDGMRQKASGWFTNSQTQFSMNDMIEIDRIEVLKGSSGLMSGDGSYGGTVNLIRKRPTRAFQGSVGVAAASWDNYRTDVDLGGPLNESGTLRGRLAAAATDGRSFVDDVKTNSQTVFGTVDLDITANTLLNVNFTHRRRELMGAGNTSMIQAYAASGQYLGMQRRSFNVGAPWSGYEQESNTVAGSLEHRFANGWVATLRGSYDKTENPRGRTGIWFTAVPQAVDFGWTRDYDNRNRSVAIEVQGPVALFGRTHELRFGADSYSTSTDSYAGSARRTDLGLDYADGGGGIPKPDFDAMPMNNHSYFSSKRRSVYAAGLFSLADPVKLIGGVRVTDYDQFDDTPYSYSNADLRERGVVTPYGGLVVDVSKNISVYGSYASIFNAQGARDAQGNTIDPEEGMTYEVGAKGEFFDNRLNVSIARFWMKTDNTAEETGEMRPTGEAIYRSVSGVVRRGYELEVSGELSPRWQVQGSYVMNSSSLRAADTVPKYQFKLASTYRLPGALEDLTVGAAARWQSKSVAGPLEQSSFWLVDLMARYQVNRQLDIGANVNNLFDKKYMSGLRDFGRVQYTWGAPRNVSVNLRYRF
ncbi:TonB-dependent siderophore receptor [Bordetella genomosp. 1]|uniref:TonB-dependent siderophore receptor n=1 Tax=Bordetella genomosp. 1 TaxID=1395607 RepID=UPI0020CF0195|nr:TonB-dependent receptor [Bordetella genomosp. 1]